MDQSVMQYRSFQFQNLSRKAYFEGWYYKQVSADGLHAISLIPGVSKSRGETNPFIQLIYGERRDDGWQVVSDWLSFAREDLEVGDEPFLFRLGSNEFRRNGISLDLRGEDLQVRGSLSFHDEVDLPGSFYMPTIMGPFSYLPGMECIHSVNSLSHQITGSLIVNRREINFTGGKGYIEKDWGSSFPKRYIWLQSNHFSDDAVLFFSWADIPLPVSSFEGYIAHLYLKGEHHRYATYTRGGIKMEGTASTVKLRLTNAYSTLEITAEQTGSAKLRAPHQGEMIHTIKEGLFGHLSFCFTRHADGERHYDETDVAGIELVWKKEDL